jgi:WD40 repeat protein
MIRVWDVEQGTCLHQLTGHLSLTSGMQLRGNILVSGNADSTVRIWNIESGKCLHTLAGKKRKHLVVRLIERLFSSSRKTQTCLGCHLGASGLELCREFGR